MLKNMGKIDRVIRGVIGIVILILGVVLKSWWGLIGVLPLATAFIAWCPAYLPFGISTSKRKAEAQPPQQQA